MPVFSRLELENFKSYQSHTVIEWKQVSSILGQNGTGKSTVIDAIEYVFCFPRYSKTSAKTLKRSLYYNKSNEDHNSDTWVKAIVNINNEEREFKRATDYKGSVHKFWVDNRVVTLQEYINSLLQVNVNPDANNFLVQQNTIELLGLKSAKERGEFFEKLSGSIVYKAEYERLVKVIKNIHSEVTSFKSILNLHQTEKENLIKRSEQIKLYHDLAQQLKQVEFDYYYIKLYEIQTNVDRLLQQKQKKQLFLNKNAKLVKEFNEKVKEYQNDIDEKNQEISDIEASLEQYEPQILNYNRKGAELAEKIEFCKNEIEKVEKNLNKAKSIHIAHEQNLEKLRKEASDVEKIIKNEFDQSVSQSCSVELDDEQYGLYLQLKAQVQKQLVEDSQHILTLERKRNNIKDKIEYYENKEKEISGQIKREQLFLNKIHAQKDNVEKKIWEAESELHISERKSTELDIEIKKLCEEVESTIKKIQEYNDQLLDFDVRKEESSYQHRMKEIVDTLKEMFPGRVLGALSDLCEITNQEKYGIAITQVLGNKMDAIVVDTANTGTKCIQFLKERYKGHIHSAVRTFLPLDDCQTKTLPNHILEIIQSKPFAKLAVTVMQTTAINNLLQKYLGNIVICETEDQAMELFSSLRLNCVSLSGFYFKKDGTFSGGQSYIKKKAKKWKENEYMNMETIKEKETQYLKSTQEDIREKQISKTKEQEKRSSLRRRLDEYLKPQLKELNERINTKQNDLEKLKNNLDTLQKSEIDELRESLSDLNKQLNNYKQREHEIEDKVFFKFCEKLQLKNIRKYEEDDVKKLEERRKHRLELDNQLSTINNEIEAEKSRDTKAIIEKLKEKLEKLKKEEKDLLKERKSWKKLENKYNQRAIRETEKSSIKCEKDEIEKKLAFEKRKLKAAEIDLKGFENTIATLDLMIQKLQRVEIHLILVKCKVKGIDIPLEEGTIDKIVVRSRIFGTESESNGQQTDSDSMIHEKNVKIDFSGLDESIRNLEGSDLTTRLNALAVQRKELKEKLESCIPTNRDLKRELDLIDAKIKNARKNIKTKQGQCKTARDELEEVKKKRKDMFEKFFEPVEKEIDGTFKSLYNNAAAQACISKINAEEPYLDGIDVGFVIPGKKFNKIEHLSGGERSMCAMALFLTVYTAKPAPCIIFDEIDAALDNANLQNIVQLFLKWKQTTQIISISHHECLFRCSDAAIGINFSERRNSSYAIHVDLTRYLKRADIDRTLAIHETTPSHSAREVTPTSPEDNIASVDLPSISSSSRTTTYGELQYTSTPKRPTGEKSQRALTPKNRRWSIGEPKYASTPSSSPKSIVGDAQQTSRGTGKIIIKSVETIRKAKLPKKRKSGSSEENDS